MMFTGFLPGVLYQGQMGGFVVLDKDIIVTRMSFNTLDLCSPSGTISLVTTNPIVTYYSMDIQGIDSLDIDDSGPLNIPVSAGSRLAIYVTAAPQCGLFGSGAPQNVPVTVQYVMQ